MTASVCSRKASKLLGPDYGPTLRTVNDGFDPGREGFKGKRFGDDFHARPQKSGREKIALHVARHEEHLQIRLFCTCRIGKLPPVQARQAHIGHEEIERLPGLENREPLRPILGLKNTVPLLLEHFHDELSHDALILDHEHGLVSPGASRHGIRGGRALRLGVSKISRKEDLDGGALAYGRIDPDMAAGLPDESVDHGEAETRALADRLRRENGSKTLASTSSDMPEPVSDTDSATY
jgi:hypothetical protein